MASDQVPAETGPVTKWFWVVTLQWPHPGGGNIVGTVPGTSVTPVSCTRRDAYEGIIAEARRLLGIPPQEHAPVLFYSLEPMAFADRRPS
jgi:hypothetical protein